MKNILIVLAQKPSSSAICLFLSHQINWTLALHGRVLVWKMRTPLVWTLHSASQFQTVKNVCETYAKASVAFENVLLVFFFGFVLGSLLNRGFQERFWTRGPSPFVAAHLEHFIPFLFDRRCSLDQSRFWLPSMHYYILLNSFSQFRHFRATIQNVVFIFPSKVSCLLDGSGSPIAVVPFLWRSQSLCKMARKGLYRLDWIQESLRGIEAVQMRGQIGLASLWMVERY